MSHLQTMATNYTPFLPFSQCHLFPPKYCSKECEDNDRKNMVMIVLSYSPSLVNFLLSLEHRTPKKEGHKLLFIVGIIRNVATVFGTTSCVKLRVLTVTNEQIREKMKKAPTDAVNSNYVCVIFRGFNCIDKLEGFKAENIGSVWNVTGTFQCQDTCRDSSHGNIVEEIIPSKFDLEGFLEGNTELVVGPNTRMLETCDKQDPLFDIDYQLS